jgi:hypothetical protein
MRRLLRRRTTRLRVGPSPGHRDGFAGRILGRRCGHENGAGENLNAIAQPMRAERGRLAERRSGCAARSMTASGEERSRRIVDASGPVTPQVVAPGGWLLSMETSSATPAAGVAALPRGPGACNGRERAHAARPDRERGRRRQGSLLAHASESQVRLQVVADQVGSKHTGDSRNAAKEGSRRGPSQRRTVDGVEMRALGDERVPAPSPHDPCFHVGGVLSSVLAMPGRASFAGAAGPRAVRGGLGRGSGLVGGADAGLEGGCCPASEQLERLL